MSVESEMSVKNVVRMCVSDYCKYHEGRDLTAALKIIWEQPGDFLRYGVHVVSKNFYDYYI